MFIIEYKDIGWWYWLVTAILLTMGISGNSLGFILAISLTLFQLIHYVIREKSIKAFPVQVRFWYLILLLVSLPEIMRWLYWLPCVGTWAQIIFGYCAMARLVSLWPWNREDAFSMNLVFNTFLSRPVRGSVQQGFSANK
jgi:CDP-diglyceride synthetase